MLKATIPGRPEREDLLGFWGAVAMGTAAALGALAWLLPPVTAAGAAGLGLAAGGALYALGHARERRIDWLYVRWNKAADGYAAWARKAVSAIWYRTVFRAVALTGQKGLDLAGSSWSERGTLVEGAYGDPGAVPGDRRSGGRGGFARWTLRSGRAWALWTLPLFGLLRMLEGRRGDTDGPDIYTLY